MCSAKTAIYTYAMETVRGGSPHDVKSSVCPLPLSFEKSLVRYCFFIVTLDITTNIPQQPLIIVIGIEPDITGLKIYNVTNCATKAAVF